MTDVDERTERVTVIPPAYTPVDFAWDADEEITQEYLVLPEPLT